MHFRSAVCLLSAVSALWGQQPGNAAATEPEAGTASRNFVVKEGTHVPLSLINSVSTKSAAVGDRVYLESVFPIMVDGRIVIPPGSYVAGTVTDVRKPGRIKGRGELHVRFDSLTLPNGITRDFRARIGTLDGRATEQLDREEGKIKSEGDKAGDAQRVGQIAVTGASIGALGGISSGNSGMGTLIGGAAGTAVGLAAVLLTRGPDANLTKGTTVEMVLDRPLAYVETELMQSGTPAQRLYSGEGPGPLPSRRLGTRTNNP